MQDLKIIREANLSAARLLPRDDKIHYLLADCRRDLEAATATLERFQERWFGSDPPLRSEARVAVGDLVANAARLRESARELLRQLEPVSPT